MLSPDAQAGGSGALCLSLPLHGRLCAAGQATCRASRGTAPSGACARLVDGRHWWDLQSAPRSGREEPTEKREAALCFSGRCPAGGESGLRAHCLYYLTKGSRVLKTLQMPCLYLQRLPLSIQPAREQRLFLHPESRIDLPCYSQPGFCWGCQSQASLKDFLPLVHAPRCFQPPIPLLNASCAKMTRAFPPLPHPTRRFIR